MSGTPHGRSRALNGRERVRPRRPEWAAPEYPPGAIPLPVLAAGALSAPGSAQTTERLVGLDRELNGPGWSPEMAELRERGAAIRRETLADLEGYLAQLTGRVEANGGVVHRAATPADGRAIIAGIARDNGVSMVVKSKSMATEELHLNRHLEEEGIEVVETDLGEYIVQLADERPSHIIAPAVHKAQADVTELFGQAAGEPVADDPNALASLARDRLREDFRTADMGISGVNFAAADTGTLTLMTNEGNGRMVTSQPRVHVAVMPVEKVIPRFTDLATLLPLLAHAASKQTLTVYQTMVTGPRREGEADGPERLHLVILDNGRTRLPGTRYEEVLACIRCGACQGACPVYRTMGGGHGYGAVYGGPIGAVLSPLLADGAQHRQLPFLSSLCGKCYDVCPVKIPLPDMLVDLRADYERDRRGGRAARLAWRAWAAAWTRPLVYRMSLRAVRAADRILGQRLLSRFPGARVWTRTRALPPLRRVGAFRAWRRKRA
ncbi:lactate utilization protein B [Allosalinactinospora lopnorensis]|uniref:lactate utilization protein B n=1 Tax=Allosalinactinospora lopnorensis TaxID=1352348 RepID=UPI0006972CD2|nr:lactate utilization protein B [Allosalinactinospora lopnorensis]